MGYYAIEFSDKHLRMTQIAAFVYIVELYSDAAQGIYL